MGKGLTLLLGLGLSLTALPTAHADIEHVVTKGHTLTAIANRYRVSVRSIVEKNKLTNPKSLRLGEVLIIPTDGKKPAGSSDKKSATPGSDKKSAAPGKGTSVQTSTSASKTSGFSARAKQPGVVRAHRLATNETYVLQVGRGRRVPAATLKKAKSLLRFPTGQTHNVEPRLLSLLATVSDHFGSRPIEVISGYRPHKTSQYTKDSRHNHGKAIDFRVVGVPNTAVRDFCRTLKNVGCGYYPNSVFVHMDAREASTYWVDYSRPGERPNYHGPNTGADESTSDVHGGDLASANPSSTAGIVDTTPAVEATAPNTPSGESGDD